MDRRSSRVVIANLTGDSKVVFKDYMTIGQLFLFRREIIRKIFLYVKSDVLFRYELFRAHVK